MNLHDVETAIRPQFIWDTDKAWQTSRKYEGGHQVGIIVYIGLSSLHGFDKSDICDKLGIEMAKFEKLHARYKKYIIAAVEIQYNNLNSAEQAFATKLKLKTGLAQSFLMHKFKAPQINYAALL